MATIKSIKEKAKAYDEALEAAVVAHKDEDRHLKATLERIFPELKESEDEKIRACIEMCLTDIDEQRFADFNTNLKECRAWLEKQGEQKPQGKTALEAINEEKVDNANKVEPRQDELTEFERAVKQVMEEAIECGDTRNLKADAEMLLSLAHNSSWNEEDEARIMAIDLAVNRCLGKWHCCGEKCPISEHNPWLKSLKDRVQPQPKQEWSVEDRPKIQIICKYLNEVKKYCADITEVRECIEWLKALIPQNTWKPSDKQMRTLEHYMHTLVCNEHKEILFGLYSDLKELRGE